MISTNEFDLVSRQKSIFRLLAFFTVGSIVIALVGEAFKTRLIWYIRFADFVDLLVAAPLYLVTLMLFHDEFLKANAPRPLRWSFLLLTMLYLYGHAMHLTANTINCFSTEINDYGNLIPEDAYDLIYFLDETLSHLIIYISRYGLFACLLMLESQQVSQEIATSRIQWPAVGIGILYGVWEAIVFTEGQKVILVPFLVLMLAFLWVRGWKQKSCPLSGYFRRGPITTFIAVLLPTMLVALGVYWLSVGGFTEPSKLSWLWTSLPV